MPRRHRRDDPERWAHERRAVTDLPLFSASAALEAGRNALAESAAKHEAEIAALVPLAQQLAVQAHPAGITVANLRIAAVQRGILSGEERGRQLSYLGKVMERAGLQPTGEWMRSSVVKTHGNLNQLWRAAP